MIDDVMLWLILAAAIAFIWCGCILTAPAKKPLRFSGAAFDDELNRAA